AREDVLEEGLRHELAPDRLEHERHLEEATTEAADVLREGEAEPAELRHLAVEREVEPELVVAQLARALERRLLGDEVGRGACEELLIFVQLEIHGRWLLSAREVQDRL